MASHGIPRVSEVDSNTGRQKQKIADYRELVAKVQAATKTSHSFSALPLASKLLSQNPEYYTIWNERRRILSQHFDGFLEKIRAEPVSQDENDIREDPLTQVRVQIKDLLLSDLSFLFPLLVKFPKCYWIWNHRLWLLQQSTLRLSQDEARKFWTDELGLATKMLAKDSRNFHGWGYRRMVVAELESERLQSKGEKQSMVKSEFDYTTRMIGTNLSNFSAWHSRSKLIPRLLDEQGAEEVERKKLLDDELQLILEALYTDPYDQSLWFYHTYLTTTFSESEALKKFSIVPILSKDEKSKYLEAEIDKLKELLPEADDCKWIYQRLLELCLDYRDLNASWPTEVRSDDVRTWLDTLTNLDPLRKGRWHDLRKRIE